jgi:hypothetical protein
VIEGGGGGGGGPLCYARGRLLLSSAIVKYSGQRAR